MAAQTPRLINVKRSFDQSGPAWHRTYDVETTELTDGHAAVIAAVAALPSPTGHRQESIQADYINRNPLWFRVAAVYRANVGGGAEAENPLERPSVLTASYSEWSDSYIVDADDKLVVNSAHERFAELPQRLNGSLVLQITKNIATYPAAAYDAIKYTTNTGAVTIKGTEYPAKSLLFLPPSVQEIWEVVGDTQYNYFQTTFRLGTDTQQHVHVIADRGFNEWIDGEHVPIQDGVNGFVSSAAPLDGEGRKTSGPPEMLIFRPYDDAAWGIDFS